MARCSMEQDCEQIDGIQTILLETVILDKVMSWQSQYDFACQRDPWNIRIIAFQPHWGKTRQGKNFII